MSKDKASKLTDEQQRVLDKASNCMRATSEWMASGRKGNRPKGELVVVTGGPGSGRTNLTTGIHLPGLNNLRRISNGTCPEEGEQVAIDEAEKTLEALAASVSGAARADAYVNCCHPTEKLLSCASCGINA